VFQRLGYQYDLMSVPRGRDLPAEHFLGRFGALCFIEWSFASDQLIADLERRRTPTVVAKLEGDLGATATWVDHQAPMRQAVQTFVSLGHRRIAFVGRETSYGCYGQAREGYLAGLREAGLPPDESLIAVCGKTGALSAYLAARPLLQAAAPPTAIVAARDSLAEGVCHAVEEAGLVVGHHVSVIGFDDMTWPEGRAFLTTFREPCYDLGAVAAEMLVERIVNGWAPPEKRNLETPFVLRRSAGPCFRPGQAVGVPRIASPAGPLAPGHEPAAP
jgi:DNA-binding LacI/PurR family transcriptional regulator